MGDIWPYGPPNHTNYATVLEAFIRARFTNAQAQIFAGIAGAEAGYDLAVVNNTPSTGDYSVGTFQINYFDGLYAGRAAAYGTPQQLVQGGLNAQVAAAIGVWRSQGFNAWSTYRSGAWQRFASGVVTSVTTTQGATTTALAIPTDINNDSSHIYMGQVSQNLWSAAVSAVQYFQAIDAL